MRTSITLLLLIGCLTPVRSAAQSGERASRLWLHLGAGGGFASSSEWERADGVAGGLMAGWTLSGHVRLGLAARGWVGETRETRGIWTTSGTHSVLVVAPAFAAYPWSRAGAYAFGGIGVASRSWGLAGVRSGPGAFLGAGYDLPTAGAFTAGPYVDYVWMDGARAFGLGLALHYGAHRAERDD